MNAKSLLLLAGVAYLGYKLGAKKNPFQDIINHGQVDTQARNPFEEVEVKPDLGEGKAGEDVPTVPDDQIFYPSVPGEFYLPTM